MFQSWVTVTQTHQVTKGLGSKFPTHCFPRIGLSAILTIWKCQAQSQFMETAEAMLWSKVYKPEVGCNRAQVSKRSIPVCFLASNIGQSLGVTPEDGGESEGLPSVNAVSDKVVRGTG